MKHLKTQHAKKKKGPNARILYILKTNMATNTEKKVIDSQNLQQGFEWEWKRKAEWAVEWRRNPKTKCDRICERDRRSGSSLRLRDEKFNTEKEKKTKLKVNFALVTGDVGYCYSFVRYQSQQNEDIPESRGKILALLLATFDR